MAEANNELALARDGNLWSSVAEATRRALAPHRAMEIRIQKHQIHRENRIHRGASRKPFGTATGPKEYDFVANVRPDIPHRAGPRRPKN